MWLLPRRFALVRHVDYTGVSGVGVVAYGVTFADGHVVLRWCSTHPATSMWSSVDDLLAIHGHGEATSIEWIDAPHGDLEEFSASSSRRRRARRRAGPESPPGTDTGDVPAIRTADPVAIPAAVATGALPPVAEQVEAGQLEEGQVEAAQARDTAGTSGAEREADPIPTEREADPIPTEREADPIPTEREADPVPSAAEDAEPVPAEHDSRPVPEPQGVPTREPQRTTRTPEPASEIVTGSAGPAPDAESAADDEPPSRRSTPGASPVRTDELVATEAWPAWADGARSEPVTRRVRRMERPSRDDPESTDPFASVLAEEPPEFLGRSNGHQHVDTITGLLDLPADLVSRSRAAEPRTTDSHIEPAPRQLRRAGRHRRDDV